MGKNQITSVETDEAVILLREIRDLLRAKVQPRRPLTHAEHMLLDDLVPAIKGTYGGECWTVKELLKNPVFAELTKLSPRELGSLLSRANGEDIGGFMIDRLDPKTKDHGAAIWKIITSQN